MTVRQSVLSASLSAALATLLLAGCGGDKPETMLASAKDYLARNDSKAAIIQIKNALQSNPNLPEARFLLGKALLDGGDPVAAELELRKAIDLKVANDQAVPVLARTLNALGQYNKVTAELAKTELTTAEAKADLQTSVAIAQAATGNADAAEKAIAAALSAQADYAPALIFQARLKAGARDFPAALGVLDKVLAKSPNNHEAWKLKGDILLVQAENDKALEAYRKAVEVRPDFVIAHAAIVGSLIQQAKLEDAGKALEALKKVAPKHPQTLYLEAQLAFRKKDFKAARELVQQLLKVAPNNPNTLQLAGAVEYQFQSYLQAESYLTKALQAAPGLALARRVLVTTYLRTGQPAKALSTLQPVLGSIDKDPNMLALAGQVYIQNGEIQKAEDYFAKAAALNPKDAPKRTALALTHMIKGNAENAFEELEQIATEDSGTTADLALIAAHLRRKETDKALKAIAALEKKQPDSPMPHQLRGNVLLAKQDLAGARKSFERALQLSPVYFPAAAALAAFDLADKKPEEARKRFEAVVTADPKNTQALLALAELKSRTGGTPEEVAALIGKAVAANPTEAAPRVALVGWHLQNKDPKKAASVAQDAVAAIPNQPELLEVLGRAQQAAGDTNQALATFAKLAGLQPNSPVPHLRAAEAHLAAKNKDAAAQSLRKGLDVKPDLVEAQRGLIMLDLDAGKPKEALAIARDVQKQRPKEPIGYMFEGDINVAQKDWGAAASAYRAGLKQEPRSDLAVKLHAVLLAGSNTGESAKFATEWIKDHPKDAAFRLHLGDVATARKDFDTAARQYRVILETQPDNAIALNNLAWVAAQQKDPKAIEYAEKANKLAPNQPGIMDTLAMIVSEKGDSARAIDLMKKALALAPQAANIRLNYARVLIKAGNKADARKELDELAKLGDKFTGQAEVVQLQKSL